MCSGCWGYLWNIKRETVKNEILQVDSHARMDWKTSYGNKFMTSEAVTYKSRYDVIPGYVETSKSQGKL